MVFYGPATYNIFYVKLSYLWRFELINNERINYFNAAATFLSSFFLPTASRFPKMGNCVTHLGPSKRHAYASKLLALHNLKVRKQAKYATDRESARATRDIFSSIFDN